MHRQLALLIAVCLVTAATVAGMSSAKPTTLRNVVERTVTAGPRGVHDLVGASKAVLHTANGVSTTIRSTAAHGMRWQVKKSAKVSKSVLRKLRKRRPHRPRRPKPAPTQAVKTPKPTPTATAKPTTAPTAKPTAVPTSPAATPTVTPSTTPSQTPTVSPTLAPDVVPTPSPSVTVRPTPTVAPTAAKTTMTNARLVSGTSSAPRVYDNVVFKGGDSTHGVLHIDYDLHDVIIRNAIVETGPQNGITINATDSVAVKNVTFQNVTVKAATCMGIEITDRTYSGRTVSNYQYITLDGVTVEPAGAEGISFDNNPKGAAYVTVRNTVIEGSGNRPDRYPWGQGFELNGVRNVTVSGLTVRQTRGPAFNLSGVGTSTPANWTFTNVVADMRVRDAQQTQSMGRESQVVYMKNATGVRFSGLVATAPTGSFNGYFDNVRNANFTGTTWQRSGASPYVSEVNGSTGNIGLP